jgi:hypothetical protein
VGGRRRPGDDGGGGAHDATRHRRRQRHGWQCGLDGSRDGDRRRSRRCGGALLIFVATMQKIGDTVAYKQRKYYA